MIQALQQPITFDEFVEWLPETSECCYELHRGVIVEMPKPRGKHSKVSGNLAYEVGTVIRQANLPYFIPKECIVRSMDGNSGYKPDVIVLDESVLMFLRQDSRAFQTCDRAFHRAFALMIAINK
jgi:Uma2 family endonuclease